jgi:hypothetical protein
MSVMIQVRNVLQALHCRLKARAALARQSLSDYLLNEIRDPKRSTLPCSRATSAWPRPPDTMRASN